MKHVNTNKRSIMIAVITTLFLILFSLWMFTKATEDVGDTENTDKTSESNKYYTPYRNNILGVAGDFCVFTKEDADLSEVTADVAVGGNFKAQSFGNYDTQWEQFYKQHLECVNLNSYVGGHYESGGYKWNGNGKKKEDLTCSTDGTCRGTYKGDHQYGQANLYIHIGDAGNENTCEKGTNDNQCKINDKDYDNPICNDEKCTHNGRYNSYNVIGVEYDFIDFEKEFENLRRISESLMNNKGAECIDCDTTDKNKGHKYTYEIPEDKDTVIITLDAKNFFESDNCDTFNIKGLKDNKKIIINVDCSSSFSEKCPITPKIEIEDSATDWNHLAENILWNFYCSSRTEYAQLEAKEIIGTILAPNIDVNINGNLDGAIISHKATSNNAIHGINSDIGWADIKENDKVEETSVVSVEKVWVDNKDADKKRPNEIKLQLLADNKEIGIITLGKNNKATIEQTKNKDKELNSNSKIEVSGTTNNDKWNCKITKLPKYKEDGKTEIQYTIKEIKISDNYETKVEKIEKDNEEETKELEYKITNTLLTEIQGKKVWEDSDNNDGYRPDKVEVTLFKKDSDGKETKVEGIKNPITVKASQGTDTNKWSYKFEKVKKYDEDGKEITYVVKEKITDKEASKKYKTEISKFTITNKHELEKTSIKVTKKWNDDNDKDGIRPNEVKVTLKSDVEEIKEQTVKLSEENNWTYTFKNLQKYKNGQEIQYKVEEEHVQGYTSEIKDKYTIINTHELGKTDVSGTKTWIDREYEDARPEKIKINLLANGEVVQTKEVTAEDNWKYEFKDLDIYKNGKKIEYTISEEELDEYETIIDGYNITNRHILVAGDEAIDIKVTKKWIDEGNENLRPDSITVKLLSNGEVIRTQEITKEEKWEHTFKQLPRYDEEGNEIEYTVAEDAISGYETSINKFEITNTYIPPVISDKFVIKINKYEKGSTKKLEGAKFEIVIKDEDGKEVLNSTKNTNSEGQIVLTDLEFENGTYTLEIKETKAPKGYKKSDDSVKIEFTVKEKNGKKVVELKNKNKNVQVDKTTMTIKVENTKEQKKDNTTSGNKLPQTGSGNMIIAGIVVVGFLAIGAIGIFKYREVKY